MSRTKKLFWLVTIILIALSVAIFNTSIASADPALQTWQDTLAQPTANTSTWIHASVVHGGNIYEFGEENNQPVILKLNRTTNIWTDITPDFPSGTTAVTAAQEIDNGNVIIGTRSSVAAGLFQMDFDTDTVIGTSAPYTFDDAAVTEIQDFAWKGTKMCFTAVKSNRAAVYCNAFASQFNEWGNYNGFENFRDLPPYPIKNEIEFYSSGFVINGYSSDTGQGPLFLKMFLVETMKRGITL